MTDELKPPPAPASPTPVDEGDKKEENNEDPLAYLSAMGNMPQESAEEVPAPEVEQTPPPAPESVELPPPPDSVEEATPPSPPPIEITLPPIEAIPPQPEVKAGLSTDDLPKVSPFVGGEADLDTGPVEAASPPKSAEVRKVEDAIRNLREKMATVATEYAEGKINQAQFHAVYTRYQEQRAITESLLARDPETNAWQQVLLEGPTSHLRSQHESRIEGFVLYLNRTGKPFLKRGEVRLDPQVMMESIKELQTKKGASTKPRVAEVEDNRWLAYVQGQHTTAIYVYLNEPTSLQRDMVADLHRDFETANQRNLTSEQFSPKSLVFPQRALFET